MGTGFSDAQRHALADVDAIQIPAATAIRPATRLSPIGSLTITAATSEAAIGFTVMVLATRVGVVSCSASTQRKNAAAPPNTPRYSIAIHCAASNVRVTAKPPLALATSTRQTAPAAIEAVTKPSGE